MNNKKIQQFLNSIEIQNTFKVMNFVLKNATDDVEEYDLNEMEDFILKQEPNSPKNIITICYALGNYAKWLENDSMYRIVKQLDKKSLWNKAKPTAKKKFISNERYEEVIHDIGVYEELNGFYYQCLFKAVFEGIYNDDLSVLTNLRASEIDGNIVTLHEDDGHTYKLKITENLANELKNLATIDVWERANRYTVCKAKIRGLHYDSVFKTEDRGTGTKGSYRHSYYSRLRKIAKEYVEHPLQPLHIYISGIMHRIKVELDKNSITLEDAFGEYARNQMAYQIVTKELIRSNYNGTVGNFKELVKGHLDSFE